MYTERSNCVIDFFQCNNLVNNPEKAAILYNSNGKGGNLTIENIGNETLTSVNSEKLLGLHIDSNFDIRVMLKK